jgi:Pyruvate/2-oxoacid:ferredoxin oxidoreductase delta subunit
MPNRQIVQIDNTKCDGCGQCVPACAEGAIRIVDGHAELVADVYCDGLGACLGHCPRGAITIVEREAQPFDESVVNTAHQPQQVGKSVPLLRRSSAENGPPPTTSGCPGMAMRDLRLNVLPAAKRPAPQPANPSASPALAHWPIQLRLVPPNAPFLHDADLFLVADCVPFACAGFHEQVLRGRPIVIGCPKLDDANAYVGKLAEMLVQSEIRSLTVVHMEVPCCTGLVRIASQAMKMTNSQIPLHDVTITITGEIRTTATV